jgi:hypothetical protein
VELVGDGDVAADYERIILESLICFDFSGSSLVMKLASTVAMKAMYGFR